jgi:hypothetical protein
MTAAGPEAVESVNMASETLSDLRRAKEDCRILRDQVMTHQITQKKTIVLVGVYMGCGDMEDGGVEIVDEEGSGEDGAGEPELTAEEQAAEDEWQAAEANRAKIREQGRIRAERYRENHPDKVKERNDAHYYKNRQEIREQQNEHNPQLRLERGGESAGASSGGAGGGLHFGVLPGCCGQLPIDTQEEATFRARVPASLCEAGCRVLETDLRKVTCEFWGKCRQCHVVEHRKWDLLSAQGAFSRTGGGGGAARGDHAGARGAHHGAELSVSGSVSITLINLDIKGTPARTDVVGLASRQWL